MKRDYNRIEAIVTVNNKMVSYCTVNCNMNTIQAFSSKDGKLVTDNAYDDQGRVVRIHRPGVDLYEIEYSEDGSTMTHMYDERKDENFWMGLDPKGRIVFRKDNLGYEEHYSYDENGKQAKVEGIFGNKLR